MLPRVSRERSSQRGVTLLELLVVAALASVLLALVLPSVRSGLGTLELRSSARRLAAAAKFARDQAIYRQRYFQLEIDAAAGKVSVIDIGGNRGRSFELPSAVRVGAILPPEPDALSRTRRFLFFPDGSSAAFQIILETPRRRVQVASDPLTGFPKVSDL